VEAEKAYHEDVTGAAELILERRNEIRLVIIAGPSSSGKTTTTIKLAEQLRKEGLKLIALNVDNYFFNLEHQPKDEFGDYDFETPEAIDLKLINQHLRDLLDYKTVQVPRYNFKTGKRLSETDPFQLQKNEIILIDTLHGLYGPMTEGIAESVKFNLYIESLSQLKDIQGQFTRWTDIRLLRRMVRDNRQRAYDPRKTLEHWHYVRRSELKHIIPYLPTADYIVNGALCYELPVLKKYLFHFFPEFVQKYQDDSAHQDAYIRSKRVFELLNAIETLENDEELVPKTSVLREFIGGSSYTYHV
jgi:uridine kinase